MRKGKSRRKAKGRKKKRRWTAGGWRKDSEEEEEEGQSDLCQVMEFENTKQEHCDASKSGQEFVKKNDKEDVGGERIRQ